VVPVPPPAPAAFFAAVLGVVDLRAAASAAGAFLAAALVAEAFLA
jgi:hypothetical protein